MVQTTGQFSGHCITNNDSGHPGFTRASRDAAALPKAAEVAQVLAAQEQSEEAPCGWFPRRYRSRPLAFSVWRSVERGFSKETPAPELDGDPSCWVMVTIVFVASACLLQHAISSDTGLLVCVSLARSMRLRTARGSGQELGHLRESTSRDEGQGKDGWIGIERCPPLVPHAA